MHRFEMKATAAALEAEPRSNEDTALNLTQDASEVNGERHPSTSSMSPRPSKAIGNYLTCIEKGFIGDSKRENEERQKERERQYVSDSQRQLQQRGVDFIHQSLDMGKLRGYLEWQRMQQDRYLYRNAEIRRSRGRSMDLEEEEQRPRMRFRQSDHQPLCPRFLSMDYPPGVRIKLRKKLETERLEMRKVNPPDPNLQQLLPGLGKGGNNNRRPSNDKEILETLPQHKAVETWNPRSFGFPPRPATHGQPAGAPQNEEGGTESMERGVLNRNRKISQGTKAVVWSDAEPKYSKENSKRKQSAMNTRQGKGGGGGSDRRAKSAAEPKDNTATVKDLGAQTPRPPPKEHPVGHLLPHDAAHRHHEPERKFVSDLIREAKQDAKNNPHFGNKPLVIYLP